jgi:hypothetical protein
MDFIFVRAAPLTFQSQLQLSFWALEGRARGDQCDTVFRIPRHDVNTSYFFQA